tara:strand:- start:8166 stop:8381 length:216 start_codon:yes stop_codon:yes gene_type:complete
MKFYIQLVHPVLGKIESEVYNSGDKEFEKIISDLNDPNKNVPIMDFYTQSGDYVIIKEDIFKNCLVYFRKK